MSTRRFLAESLAPVVDFIYPPRCPACGDSVGEQGGLCHACWNELLIPSQPNCRLCQRPFGEEGPEHGATCAPCFANPPVHDGIAAGTLYGETARKLILALKHGRRIALAPMLARLIAARIPEIEAAENRIIVPVPLHRQRLWQRGYNQAALLGRELEKLGHGKLVVDALLRTRPTPLLGRLGAKARKKVLSGAIAINPKARADLDGAGVLLVDDVLTSGATSSTCVKVLKRSGAKTVRIACFARVLEEVKDLSRRAA